MCQLPLIRMCVCRMRSPENCISRCLPRAVTDSMVRPASGRSSSTRVSDGSTDSNRAITFPAERAVQRPPAR